MAFQDFHHYDVGFYQASQQFILGSGFTTNLMLKGGVRGKVGEALHNLSRELSIHQAGSTYLVFNECGGWVVNYELLTGLKDYLTPVNQLSLVKPEIRIRCVESARVVSP